MLAVILMDSPAKAEAEAMFRRHLEVAPDDPMTLHSLGQLLQGKGNDQDAVALFRRAAAGKPDLIPVFNDLAVSLNRLGQRDEALAVLDHALHADPGYAVAHDNRGMVLYDCRRFMEAAEAHLTALAHTPVEATAERISILLHLSKAAYEGGDYVAAEQSCRFILELEADNTDAIEHLAMVLGRLLRHDEALALLNRLARLHGLSRSERSGGPAEATLLLLGGVGAGHVPTRYLFDPALFSTLTLTLLSSDQADAPLGDVSYAALAEADLVFNTLGEVDKDGGQTDALNALVARLGKPILNPSDRVARTGRDHVQELFGDIPGLRVPAVRWATRDELAALSDFTKPQLIRPGGSHGGKDLSLIQSASDMAEYLAKIPHDRFLLSDFYDFKGDRGCYRKYRIIFVDRQPFPYHLAVAESWLVHYWRAEMGVSEWKKREEEAFLTDWRQVFGPLGAAAVDLVGQRLDLDYGGMDCSILLNGEVLFFEANACMLVHLDDAEAEFPYKHQAVPRIREAVTRMVRDRLARAAAG
jgi:Flp pilus assembly protein TadD